MTKLLNMSMLAAVMATGMMSIASAQTAYPAKPVRIVVPYAAGGSTDLLARTLAQKMTDSMGQPVIVENRAGGGGMPGSASVARAAPDGYTVVLGTGATHGLVLFLTKGVPYDPVRDFTPITAAVEVPIALAVHPSVPARNAREFADFARSQPGKLSFGSSGSGSPHHLAGELLNQVASIDVVHVPYKGAGPSMQDLLGGQIPAVFTTLSTALPQARAGKIRLLGVVEANRARSAPDVPTIGESLLGYAMPNSWLGFFGPAGLPADITARLNTEFVKALNDTETRTKLEAAGLPVVGSSANAFAEMVRRDIEAFQRIVTRAGIKPE